MISGEYVVLDGAVALVAAVDARAVVRWARGFDGSPAARHGSPGSSGLPPEVLLTRRLAEAFTEMPSTHDALTLDVSALRRDGRKLGLGSSAAAAAATVGAVFARSGRDLRDAGERRAMLTLALEGHRSVAPEGSGADVAASVLGGLVRFARDPESGAVLEATPVAFPANTEVRVVWTGHEARTSDLVRRVRALAETDRRAYDRAMGALRDAAARLADAVAANDATALVRAAGEHHDAMAQLGRASGAPIVDAGLARTAELARKCGGAAKPSGAGGGDVALAFFADAAAAEAFAAECPQHGLDPVTVTLGAEGVREHRETTP
jgi:phosphomevalonate kinase